MHPAVARALDKAMEGARFPHAVLIEGGGADLRLTLAKRIAQALLCTGEAASLFGPAERPCGSCAACVKAEAGVHPDLFLISGGETARSFHIEAVRRLRSEAYILPNEAERKIYILENTQSMTQEAQNALLKLLEEPPGAVCFLLLCSNKNRMLRTILSRVSLFSLGGPEETAGEESAVSQRAEAVVRALGTKRDLALLRESAAFAKDKELFRAVLPELRELLREALLLRVGAGRADSSTAVRDLAVACSQQQLLDLLTRTREIEAAFVKNENYNLVLTRFCSVLSGVMGL